MHTKEQQEYLNRIGKSYADAMMERESFGMRQTEGITYEIDGTSIRFRARYLINGREFNETGNWMTLEEINEFIKSTGLHLLSPEDPVFGPITKILIEMTKNKRDDDDDDDDEESLS